MQKYNIQPSQWYTATILNPIPYSVRDAPDGTGANPSQTGPDLDPGGEF
jgi:hypothetical protein